MLSGNPSSTRPKPQAKPQAKAKPLAKAKCRRCGRRLSEANSIKHGYGTVCNHRVVLNHTIPLSNFGGENMDVVKIEKLETNIKTLNDSLKKVHEILVHVDRRISSLEDEVNRIKNTWKRY